jgi:acid phosphatase type 7
MAPIAKLSKAVPAEASTTRGTLPFKHLLLGSDQHKLFLKFLGRWRHALGRAYTGLWLGLMSLAVLSFSLSVVTIPGEAIERVLLKQPWLNKVDRQSGKQWALTAALFEGELDRVRQTRDSPFTRNLVLPDADLVDEKSYADAKISINLRGRDLNYAILWGADPKKADLKGARLNRANVVGADLRGTDLSETQLQGADIRRAQLQGAILAKAQLQGAILAEAQLQGAIFEEAQLQGAIFEGAQLQGANLGVGELDFTKLQGADFYQANLQGADLSGAELQGADLRWANLQGADLSGAGIFLVRTDANTNLSRADLRDVNSEPLAPETQAALKAELEKLEQVHPYPQAIPHPQMRAVMLERLELILSDRPLAWEPEILPKDKRRDVLMSEGAPEPVRMLTGGKALVSPRDDGMYSEALAAELAQLACGFDDGQIASRLVQRMVYHDLGFPDFARHLTAHCPNLITKLDKWDQRVLIAATAPVRAGTVLLAAGDIGECAVGQQGPYLTADLLAAQPEATILALGDLAYSSGTAAEFANCYGPIWGRFKDRTRPVPGNHEYKTAAASGYFDYWGGQARPAGNSYYSFDLGDWHLVALDSSIEVSGGSGQARWLRSDLATSTARCKLAFFHRPRFSSGEHGDATEMGAIFQSLYDARVSVALAGYEHHYERFAPMSPSGEIEPGRGVRSFVVGTGGAPLRALGGAPRPGSEARQADAKGVLQLKLRADGYDWAFLPVAGASYSDSGSGTCVPAGEAREQTR